MKANPMAFIAPCLPKLEIPAQSVCHLHGSGTELGQRELSGSL